MLTKMSDERFHWEEGDDTSPNYLFFLFSVYLKSFQREGLCLNYPKKVSKLFHRIQNLNGKNFIKKEFDIDILEDTEGIKSYFHELTSSTTTPDIKKRSIILENLFGLKYFARFLETCLPKKERVLNAVKAINILIHELVFESKNQWQINSKELSADSLSVSILFNSLKARRYLDLLVKKYDGDVRCTNRRHYNFLLRFLLAVVVFKHEQEPRVACNITIDGYLVGLETSSSEALKLPLTDSYQTSISRSNYILLDENHRNLFILYYKNFRPLTDGALSSKYFFLGINSKEKLEDPYRHLYFYQTNNLNLLSYVMPVYHFSQELSDVHCRAQLRTHQEMPGAITANDKAISYVTFKIPNCVNMKRPIGTNDNQTKENNDVFDTVPDNGVSSFYLNILNLSEIDTQDNADSRKTLHIHPQDSALKAMTDCLIKSYPLSIHFEIPSNEQIRGIILKTDFAAQNAQVFQKQIIAVGQKYEDHLVKFCGEFVLDTRLIPQFPQSTDKINAALEEISISKKWPLKQNIAEYIFYNYRKPPKRLKVKEILTLRKITELRDIVNTQFWKKRGLVIKYNLPHRGRGIFTTRPYIKDEVVTDLHGKYYDLKDENEEHDDTDYMYFFRYDGKKYCCDATEESCTFGRLINHSSCCNNVVARAVVLTKDQQPHLIYVALCDIGANEEILDDYGDRDNSELMSFDCPKCGIIPKTPFSYRMMNIKTEDL